MGCSIKTNLKPFIEEKGCMALNTINPWQNVIFENNGKSLKSNTDNPEVDDELI